MEFTKEIEPIKLNRAAHEEKHTDKAAAFLIDKLAKHSVIIKKGTTFLIIFSILALYAAMYLIHMEKTDRHTKNPVVRAAVR